MSLIRKIAILLALAVALQLGFSLSGFEEAFQSKLQSYYSMRDFAHRMELLRKDPYNPELARRVATQSRVLVGFLPRDTEPIHLLLHEGSKDLPLILALVHAEAEHYARRVLGLAQKPSRENWSSERVTLLRSLFYSEITGGANRFGVTQEAYEKIFREIVREALFEKSVDPFPRSLEEAFSLIDQMGNSTSGTMYQIHTPYGALIPPGRPENFNRSSALYFRDLYLKTITPL